MTDRETPTTADLAAAFRLRHIDASSLTPHARVYRAISGDGAAVVIKRTPGDAERTAALVAWTEALAGADVPVVTPVPLQAPNPREIDGEHWVVYPWVSGADYEGTSKQIRLTGDFLGRMHAAAVPTAGLREYGWPETGWDDVATDLETLDGILAAHEGDASAVRELGRRWWEESFPALRAAEAALVRTAVSSDYKANNLIFTAAGPMLVDPDNGGLEPRIFDLALALTLFHNECPGAPGRLFTAEEWQTFAGAYARHVQFSEAERELWPAALDHMLWEEGTWVLEDNDDAAWADPRQRAFLLDLAAANPERYPLP